MDLLIIDDHLRTIFDSLQEGVLIIDTDAKVRYVNSAYTKITGVEAGEIVDSLLVDVRPGARLPSVLTSGEKILRASRRENGVEYIVNMYPIVSGGRIIGAISLVIDIQEAIELTEEVSNYKKRILSLENTLKSFQRARYSFSNIIAEDDKSIEMKLLAQRIATKDTSVLITGESGTGKELYAQAIHNHSHRSNGPFVAINCATIGSNLLESELFGYSEGAFTGAVKGGKTGLFEAANGGTIFLDEIGEMDISLQSKLLRSLQEGIVRRVGDVKEYSIDVRVIAATNKKLEDMIAQKSFREDLFYRIAVFPINIPPLRERRRDIIPITKMFIQLEENKAKRRIDIDEQVSSILYNYDWPGNIRELKNCVEFALNMMNDFLITSSCLPSKITSKYFRQSELDSSIGSLADKVRTFERMEIYKALELYGRDLEGKKIVSEKLGISLATLYNKLKEF